MKGADGSFSRAEEHEGTTPAAPRGLPPLTCRVDDLPELRLEGGLIHDGPFEVLPEYVVEPTRIICMFGAGVIDIRQQRS